LYFDFGGPIMSYWVYGKDSATGQPSEPFFCDAESEEAARQQASAEGIVVEEVEHVAGAQEQLSFGAPRTASAAAQRDRGEFGRGVSRGVIWLVGGCCLIAVSYILAYAMNDYVMEGTVQQASGRARRLSSLAGFIRLTRDAGLIAAAAGGVMWIVDTSPNRSAR
jgi:hypothetical protein